MLFSQFLIDKFVPSDRSVSTATTRKRYGYLGGWVGVIANVVLFAIKLVLGTTLNSISLIADSFNNLSDVAASGVTILGFKLADKRPDKEHPFGHARTEYLSALIISMIILFAGFELISDSFKRIRNPSALGFSWLSIGILVGTIVVKLWLSSFNKELGRRTKSKALDASALDSLSDVFATSSVIVSLVISQYVDFPLDAYIGIMVAGFILFNGYSMAKDTVDALLGQAPDPELVTMIKDSVMDVDGIKGAHDLIIHDYGPGKTMGSIHVELSADLPPLVSHEIVDEAERRVREKYDISLLIHVDPLEFDSDIVNERFEAVKAAAKKHEHAMSVHDFRLNCEGQSMQMSFIITVDENTNDAQAKDLKEMIHGEVAELYPECVVTITVARENTFVP